MVGQLPGLPLLPSRLRVPRLLLLLLLLPSLLLTWLPTWLLRLAWLPPRLRLLLRVRQRR